MNQKVISSYLKNKFQNKKILILGLGREGLSTYKFLRGYLPEQRIDLADEKSLEKLSKEFQENFHSLKQDVFYQLKSFDNFDNFDFIFISPGISRSKLTNIQYPVSNITSNTQLFFELARELKITVIGVTGSKGKSTTTALIHHVLKANGIESYLGGNIGTPALDLIKKLKLKIKNNNPIYFVIELSSHQLANLTYSPDIAVIQTIVPEHLDYYKNFDEYTAAKANICKYQSESDLLIYFEDNEIVKKIVEKSNAKKIPFSTNNFISLDKTKLKGKHNLINMMPSIIISQKLGLSESQIKKALKTFKGLPHRLEFVANVNGVEYYNDSLATNPHATIAALETFADRQIILITGGFDRGLDYAILAKKITNSNIKKLILFPDTGEKILNELRDINHNSQTKKLITHNSYLIDRDSRNPMLKAIVEANKSAKSGDIVLLSPASASFNMFADYADRGNQFKAAVKKLCVIVNRDEKNKN